MMVTTTDEIVAMHEVAERILDAMERHLMDVFTESAEGVLKPKVLRRFLRAFEERWADVDVVAALIAEELLDARL